MLFFPPYLSMIRSIGNEKSTVEKSLHNHTQTEISMKLSLLRKMN